MMHLKSIFLLAFLGYVLALNQAYAAFFTDPSLNWRTLKTPHFNIHFHDDEEELAKTTAIVAERAHHRLSRFFGWQPVKSTEIVLIDRMDFSNGSATPLPRNTMNIIVSPPDDIGSLDDYDDWLDLLIVHEYTHIVHLDKTAGFPYMLRKVLGRLLGLFPNAFQPAWGIEGIATYMETDSNKGIGRGQSSSFKALMRMEVNSGIKPIQQINQPMVTWPAGTARYLYGVYFYQFITEHYGEERIRRWTTFYSNNFIPFRLNGTAKESFSKNMNALWADFSQDLELKFLPEIYDIKEKGVVEGVNISNAGYFTGYPRALPNGDIYYAQTDFQSHSKIMRLRQGAEKPEKFVNVNSDRFDIHPDSGIVIAQIELTKSVNYFSDLYTIDLKRGKINRLTRGQRYTFATWSPDGQHIIAVQNHQGNKSLHLLTREGNHLETLWRGYNKEVISQPDWSPDGQSIVAAVWRQESRWNLEKFDLTTKSWQQLTHTSNNESQPQYSANGKSILFSADYGDIYNIYRMELDSGNINAMTNIIGAALSATQIPGTDDIYYMGLNSGGYDVYHLGDSTAKAQPLNSALVATSTLKSPVKNGVTTTADEEIDAVIEESLESRVESYSGIDKLVPTSWFPIIGGDTDTLELGVATSGSDPINRHNYAAALVYDVENNFWLGEIDYLYDRWNPSIKLHGNRHSIRYADNAGNLSRFRISESYGLELIFPQLKRDRQLAYHAAIVGERESDALLAKGAAPAPTSRDEILGLALSYNSASFYPKAISPADGQRFRLVAEDSDLLNSDFSGQVYTLDWRGYLTLHKRHVLATRLLMGWGTDNPNPFKLGGTTDGFGIAPPAAAPFVPTTAIFNRRSYALRGYPTGLPELRNRRMGLVELEWRFPIALIERGFMVPPVGVHQLYGKVFYNAGDAWHNQVSSAKFVQGAGFEINTEFVLGYFFGINLRLGYAHGFDDNGEDQFYVNVGGTY